MKFLYFLAPVALFCHPTNPEVLAGSFEMEFDTSNIQQIYTSDRAILNWETFSIQLGETTQFNLPDESAMVLNRVTGTETSEIFGHLFSNGQVFIINPNGILMGESAVIDTHSFLISTLDLENDLFLNGQSYHFTGLESGSIVNLGTINAKGDVLFLAHQIEQNGSIEAGGNAYLGCGTEILFQPKEETKFFIRPTNSGKRVFEGLKNGGSIHANAVNLVADGNLYEYAIQLEGETDALNIVSEGGKILLSANDGVNWVNGGLKSEGGSIHVLGKENFLMDRAVLDVSSHSGGGEILIGGDYRGENPEIPNGDVSYVHENAKISADALVDGNGGKVVIWSDEVTGFYGSISAIGGSQRGDGGFVEVSGKGIYEFKGNADCLAVNGQTGTLLLDPTDISILPAPATTTNIVLVPNTPSAGTSTYQASPNTASSATILNTDFNAALAAANLIVTTNSNGSGNGDINVLASVGGGVGFPNALTFNADRDINMGDGISPLSIRSDLDVTLNATRDINLLRVRLESNDQQVFINTGGNFLNDAVDVFAQTNIAIDVGGDVNLLNSSNYFSSGDLSANCRNFINVDSIFSSNGSIIINARGDVSYSALTTGVQSDCLGDFLVTCRNFMSSTVPAEAVDLDCPGLFQIIAEEDITILDRTFIGITTGPSSQLNLVVDNAFPTSPFFGTGSITLDNSNGEITSNGPVRIYTSQRDLNSIGATTLINGAFFVPGPFDVDSLTEQWNTYFASSFGGVPFTIFYKFPDVLGPAVQRMQESPLAANAEMFRDLHQYDEWVLWFIEFDAFFEGSGLQDFSPYAIPRRYRAYNLIPLLPEDEDL